MLKRMSLLALATIIFTPLWCFGANGLPTIDPISTQTITYKEALNMSRTQLGDMFLPAGYPQIKEVVIRSIGMDAPSPFLTQIVFYSVGKSSTVLHFCERTIITMNFEAVDGVNAYSMIDPPSRPINSASQQNYGWNSDVENQNCEGKSKSNFYHVEPENKLASLSIIYQIGELQKMVISGQTIRVQIEVRDETAPRTPRNSEFQVTDIVSIGAAALARIPLEHVFSFTKSNVNYRQHNFGPTFPDEDVWEIHTGDFWTIYAHNNSAGYLTKLYLRRSYPAPF